MKTPEDEAFDELARKQGAWGGGFPAKRAMAADKLHWSDCAVHNGPAYPAGECDCGVEKEPVDRLGQLLADNNMPDTPTARAVYRKMSERVEEDDDIQDYKKPWVGLTDEEMENIRASFLGQFLETWEFAYKVQVATQAKLKEKNT